MNSPKTLEALAQACEKENFVDFLNKSPCKGISLDLKRDKSIGREIDLGMSESDDHTD